MKAQKYTKEQAVALVEDCYDRGEPIFIIRGKDKIAWKAIKQYAELLKTAIGPENYNESYLLAEKAEKFAAEVIAWQGHHLEEIKNPN